MRKYNEPLLPGRTYYLFNRTVGDEIAFRSKKDYEVFLEKYNEIVLPVAETLSYCLLPEQFHFIITLDHESRLKEFFQKDHDDLSIALSRQIGRLFNSFTVKINDERKRNGNIFLKPFKREMICDPNELKIIARHIHQLPLNSGLIDNPMNWHFSSFNSISNRQPSLVNAQETISYFGNHETFRRYHEMQCYYKMKFPETIVAKNAA